MPTKRELSCLRRMAAGWLALLLAVEWRGSRPLRNVEEGDELLSLIGSDLVDRDEDKDE